MDSQNYLGLLNGRSSFSRDELHNAMNTCGRLIGEALFKVKLRELLFSKNVVRVGRNAYCVPEDGIQRYHYEYSKLADGVTGRITEEHPFLDFTVFETIQLNEFVNHQLAHNVVFVSVEGDLGDFVFNTIKETYPGKVLVNPTNDIFHQYWYDDMIVVIKLVTEAPKDQGLPWATRLEKLLVDIIADPLVRGSISESEYHNIYTEAFHKYVIDESCLFRYARRRGAEKELLQFIKHRTDIQLRTRS